MASLGSGSWWSMLCMDLSRLSLMASACFTFAFVSLFLNVSSELYAGFISWL